MKRSEMVDKVIEFLNLCFEGEGNQGRQYTASALVSLFEKEGMLPPFSQKVYQKNCKILQEPHGNSWDEEA
jgi:EAL domain-containing protein (putative c-di-GMP-specific phosphodiesterase class I)